MARKIEVCLSPQLLELYDLSNNIVVVADIFRATTTMITALSCGVSSIKAVSTIEEAFHLRNYGYLIAGERGGRKVDGFDFGNSPFDFIDKSLNGSSVAITTTNGTLSINKSSMAKYQVIGSFNNISATADYLKDQGEDVLILCAGWKGAVNLEDTIFAGALINTLGSGYHVNSDSGAIALSLYLHHQNDLLSYLINSDHAMRLKRIGYEKDISFCLQKDTQNIVGVVKNGEIVAQ